MAAAAKLLIDIAADIAKLRTDFNEAGKVVADFGKGVEKIGNSIKTALGALGVGLSIEGLRQIVDQVADIGEAADKVNLGTDAFQALTAAMRDAGVSAENTSSLLARANQTLGKAFDGSKEQIELLQRLKVGLVDAQGNAATFEQTLPRVARAILDIENPMQRASAAAAFFGGKVGKEAIPALEAMAKGTEALKAQYQSEIVPEETIRRFDEFSDKLKSLSVQAVVQIADLLNKAFSPQVVEEFRKVNDEWAKFAKQLADLAGGNVPFTLENFLNSTAKELQAIAHWANNALTFLLDLRNFMADPLNYVPTITVTGQAPGILDKRNQQYGAGTGAPDPFKGFPTITGSGVDKFTEAMTRLKAEIEATQAAIDVFNRSTGLPTKEAERLAKLAGDIGTKQAQMIKGVADAGQQEQIKAQVETLERLKFALDDLKQVQSTADEVSRKFGDGQKELADRVYFLDKAYQAGKISLAEYDAALKEANETAERQALQSKEQVDGIEGVAAGFQFAALSMTQAQSDFQIGQDLFNAGFQTMSQAISEFVDKGTIDFGKLSAAFAKMLLEMAIRWAAMSFLRAAVSGLGGLFGSAGAGTSTYGSYSPVAGSVFYGGPRANGGPVWPGMSYMVGEYGVEKFVPEVAGHIVPNGGGGGDVIINNYAQAKVSANRRGNSPNWEVLIEPLEVMMAGRLSRGQGAIAPAIEGRYGVGEQGRR